VTPFWLKFSFIVAIAGHGGDLASTEHCLGAGRCRELNPWLARFNDPAAFGAAKMGVAGVSEVWLYDLSKSHPKLAFVANIAIGATFSAIAMHNSQQAKGVR
jgi:hypothetical protein